MEQATTVNNFKVTAAQAKDWLTLYSVLEKFGKKDAQVWKNKRGDLIIGDKPTSKAYTLQGTVAEFMQQLLKD